jgi:hypothetical protein
LPFISAGRTANGIYADESTTGLILAYFMGALWGCQPENSLHPKAIQGLAKPLAARSQSPEGIRLPSRHDHQPGMALFVTEFVFKDVFQCRIPDLLEFVAHALMRLADLHHPRQIDRRGNNHQIHIGAFDRRL